MEYRTLGKTGLHVSAVSIGLWAIGGDKWGAVHDRDSLAAMQCAWELGVNFFDTADVYGRGHSEELVGEFLRTIPRDEIYVATKGGLFRGRDPNPYTDPQLIIEDCEDSLRRLQTEHIDLYQNHVGWDTNVEVFAEAFMRLRQQGKIRFFGLSSNDFRHIQHFDAACGGMDTIQIDYSLLNRRPEQQIFPFCSERNIGVIARGPLAMGKLTGKFTPHTQFPEGDIRRGWTEGENRQTFLQDLNTVDQLRFLANDQRTMAQAALGFVLSHPTISTTIPGAKTAQQVRENVGALIHPLSKQELVEIENTV